MDVKTPCAEHTWVLREMLYDDFGVGRDEECAACGQTQVRADGRYAS
jgi:hypothetical protein